MSNRKRHVGDRENPKASKCLGVFGLSLRTTEEDLRHLFSRYGRLEDVQLVKDNHTRRSRGFAFVYFESLDDAAYAKERCHGKEIDGRSMRCDFSITRRAHTPTPGVYLGASGGSSRGYSGGGGGGGGSSRGYRDNYGDRDRRYGGGGGGYYDNGGRRSRSRSYDRDRDRDRYYGGGYERDSRRY